jgi:hypothetical protein
MLTLSAPDMSVACIVVEVPRRKPRGGKHHEPYPALTESGGQCRSAAMNHDRCGEIPGKFLRRQKPRNTHFCREHASDNNGQRYPCRSTCRRNGRTTTLNTGTPAGDLKARHPSHLLLPGHREAELVRAAPDEAIVPERGADEVQALSVRGTRSSASLLKVSRNAQSVYAVALNVFRTTSTRDSRMKMRSKALHPAALRDRFQVLLLTAVDGKPMQPKRLRS